MDWEFLSGGPTPLQSHLLVGCSLEAERADRVALGLDALRAALPESFHVHMIAVIKETFHVAKLLRDLADCSNMHHPMRSHIVCNYLEIILPCLSRSLRDITNYYNNKNVSRQLRWRKMYHEMMKEAGGLTLSERFALYNHFLVLLLYLLNKDKHFNPLQLEVLSRRILDLCQRRGIPAPNPIEAPRPLPIPDQLVRQETAVAIAPLMPRTHWAERVFALPLSSHTPLNLPDRSQALGPFVPAWDKNRPRTKKRLMKRSFNGRRLLVEFILNAETDSPCVVTTVHGLGAEWFSYLGHHEICVERVAPNELVLRRWSYSTQRSKPWVILDFATWEELVLFHCTFSSLKAQNSLTVSINAAEYKLRGERRLFQAQIIDDEYHHSLIVYQDKYTQGIRLHAAVWNGILRESPVWTAFVTHQSASPTWLVSKSKHLVLVKDLKPYVFCQKYKEANMRRNKAGVFEIYFVSEQAAARFREVFYPARLEVPEPDEPERIAGPSSYA